MSINTAFYQIAKNVTASDLAKIIGAKITGIETALAEKAVIKDIAPFHSASASKLVYQTDPKLLVGLNIKATIIITNEAGAAAVSSVVLALVDGSSSAEASTAKVSLRPRLQVGLTGVSAQWRF